MVLGLGRSSLHICMETVIGCSVVEERFVLVLGIF